MDTTRFNEQTASTQLVDSWWAANKQLLATWELVNTYRQPVDKRLLQNKGFCPRFYLLLQCCRSRWPRALAARRRHRAVSGQVDAGSRMHQPGPHPRSGRPRLPR